MKLLTVPAGLIALCAMLCCCCGVGCVSEVEKEDQWLGGVLEQQEYPPLENVRLSLDMLGTREFVAGEPARIPFTLRNYDSRTVRIVEWYANEPDNVKVYCQVWLPGMEEPDDELWLPLEFDVKQPALRYPLELTPGSSTVVNKELTFVENLVVSPGMERRYFLRGELNLTSIKLSSPVIAISVRAPESMSAPKK